MAIFDSKRMAYKPNINVLAIWPKNTKRNHATVQYNKNNILIVTSVRNTE